MGRELGFRVLLVFFVALLGLSVERSQVLACSNLGPGKHMGVVKMIDPIQGVFSIVDAETRRSVRFETEEKLLKTIHVDDTIVVRYLKTEKGPFIAKEIVVHRVAGSFSGESASLRF